jgi:hypothetical protein
MMKPLSLDIEARRVFPVRGGAIAAEYGDASIDVGIGRHTVTVFAYTATVRAGPFISCDDARRPSRPNGFLRPGTRRRCCRS